MVNGLQSGELSAESLLDHCETSFLKHNPSINAIIKHDFDSARQVAKQSDAARKAGHALGPLAGIPFSIKESFDVAGWPTTCGDPANIENIATEDSAVVSRLRRAGAVLVGKSNVPLYLRDWQSYNDIYGVTRNPHDLTRTPGGSSGGSAAAVCSGMSAFDVGSDIGSSLRNPAHYCGVFSHKTTHGLISLAGHGIQNDDPTPDINVAGSVARSAFDLEILLSVLTENHAPLASVPQDLLKTCRIGVLPGHPFAPVDNEVSNAISAMGQTLKAAGAAVVDQAMPDIDAADLWRTYVLMLRAATSPYMNDSAYLNAQRHAADYNDNDNSYAALQYVGATIDHRQWLMLAKRRRQFSGAWAHYFSHYDVLLCPAAATPAFTLNQTGEPWQRTLSVNGQSQPMTTQLFWAGLSGLCGLPSTVAPAGRSSTGLPVGVQIVAAYGHDLTALRIAQWIEQLGYGYTPPSI